MPPLPEGEYEALKASIKTNGVITKVLRSAGPHRKGDLIDGAHRVRACKELGITAPEDEIPVENETAFRILQIESNTARRQLDKPQRVQFAVQLSQLYAIQAKERIKAGVVVPEGEEKGRTTELAGEKFGVKRNLVEAAMFIDKHGDAKIKDQVLKGEVAHHAAVKIIKQDKGIDIRSVMRNKTAQRIAEKLPTGKYGAIIIHPPLRTELMKAQKGLLTIQEVQTLDIHRLAGKDAVVALIVPQAWLKDAIRALDHWDARFFGIVPWMHDHPTQNVLHEHCLYILLATFGKVPLQSKKRDYIMGGSPTNIPSALVDLLDEWSPDAAGVVLFGRTKREGWSSWEPVIDAN
jgi:N6-adenosine-specific RNA methylase IME4